MYAEIEHRANTVKFDSGVTYNEAELIVDAYLNSISHLSHDCQISLLKAHLSRAVRDHKLEREIISACAAERS
jgi:hypothetical protein